MKRLIVSSMVMFAAAAHAQFPAEPESVLPPRFKTLSRQETNRKVFLEITKANLLSDKTQYGKLVILDFLTRHHAELERRGERYSTVEWRALMNKALTDYNNQAKLLDDPSQVSTRGFDYVKLGVSVVTSMAKSRAGKAAKAVTDAAVEASRDLYVKVQGSHAQRKVQDELNDIPYKAGLIVDRAYAAGRRDPAFAEAYDDTLSLDGRAEMRKSAKYNIDRNLHYVTNLHAESAKAYGVKIYEILSKSVNEKGQLTFDVNSIKEAANEVQKRLSEEIQAGVKQIEKYIDAKENDRLKKQQEREDKQLVYETASSSVYLLSGFAGLIDSNAARHISAVGMAGIQIAMAINDFTGCLAQSAGKIAMGALNLAAGVGMAVQALMGAIMGGPSPEQMILEQIQKLGEQIRDLRQEMHDRFDTVDRSINNVLNAVLVGFEQVEAALRSQSINIEKMQQVLGEIQSNLQYLQASMYVYLKAGFRERIHEEIAECLLPDPNFDLAKFAECVKKFETFATQHAQNALAAGPADVLFGRDRSKPEAALARLGRELEKGVWNNINVIGRATSFFLGDTSLTLQEGSALVNGEEWALYANAFTALVGKYPQYLIQMPELVEHAMKNILTAGDSLSAATRGLSEFKGGQDPHSGEGYETHPLREALDLYETRVASLKTAIAREWDTFRYNPRKGRARGYDPNLPPEKQTKKFRIGFGHAGEDTQTKELWPCAGFSFSDINRQDNQTKTLNYPAGYGDLIPAEFHMAQDLGLGTVEVCYDEVGWNQVRNLIWVRAGDRLRDELGARIVYKEGGRDFIDGNQVEELRIRAEQRRYFEPRDPRASLADARYRFLMPLEVRSYGKVGVRVTATFRFTKGTDNGTPLVISKRKIVATQERNGSHFGVASFVNRDQYAPLDELVKRHGADRKNWLSAYGWYVYWANGNVGNPANKSVLSEELMFRWTEANGLAANFKQTTTEQVSQTERDRNVQIIRKALEEKFQDLRELFNLGVRAELEQGGPVQIKADAATGAKRFLEALYALSFPQSMASNDELHSFFFGENTLLDKELMMDRSVNGEEFQPGAPLVGQGSKSMFDTNEERLKRLRGLTERITHSRAGKEIHENVQDARSRLEILKMMMGVAVPAKPLAQALKELQEAVRHHAGIR